MYKCIDTSIVYVFIHMLDCFVPATTTAWSCTSSSQLLTGKFISNHFTAIRIWYKCFKHNECYIRNGIGYILWI